MPKKVLLVGPEDRGSVMAHHARELQAAGCDVQRMDIARVEQAAAVANEANGADMVVLCGLSEVAKGSVSEFLQALSSTEKPTLVYDVINEETQRTLETQFPAVRFVNQQSFRLENDLVTVVAEELGLPQDQRKFG